MNVQVCNNCGESYDPDDSDSDFCPNCPSSQNMSPCMNCGYIHTGECLTNIYDLEAE